MGNNLDFHAEQFAVTVGISVTKSRDCHKQKHPRTRYNYYIRIWHSERALNGGSGGMKSIFQSTHFIDKRNCANKLPLQSFSLSDAVSIEY